MSGPITSGGQTRQEKEIDYVVESIESRLTSLKNDEYFQVRKAITFSVSVLLAMGGVTLVLFGLHKTFFFQNYRNQPTNIPALVFGGLFMTPMLYWFYYVFIPSKREQRFRKKIAMDRRERNKPTLFNQLVEEARKATEPPPRRIRVLAHIRKHDYPVVASTMGELAEAIANQCGLAVERQLLRYNEEDLVIELDKKLDEHYGMENNARVYVYNKGGFFTSDSPLKNARPQRDLMRMNEDLEQGPGSPVAGGGGGGGAVSSSGSRTSINTGGGGSRPSFSQGGRSSFGGSTAGLKSALSDPSGRDSMRDSMTGASVEKKKGNVSFKS